MNPCFKKTGFYLLLIFLSSCLSIKGNKGEDYVITKTDVQRVNDVLYISLRGDQNQLLQINGLHLDKIKLGKINPEDFSSLIILPDPGNPAAVPVKADKINLEIIKIAKNTGEEIEMKINGHWKSDSRDFIYRAEIKFNIPENRRENISH